MDLLKQAYDFGYTKLTRENGATKQILIDMSGTGIFNLNTVFPALLSTVAIIQIENRNPQLRIPVFWSECRDSNYCRLFS